jgi:phage-related protein
MMNKSWEIIYFQSISGSNPIRDFILSLNIHAQGKVARTLDLLSNYNIHVREPHAKKLHGTPLWELRIIGGDNIRIFYVAVLTESFLLLHGFEKRTDKIPHREIETALSRFVDWKRRN